MNIPTEERKLLPNGNVEQTVIRELPRYEGFIRPSQAECDMIVEDIKFNCKVWTMKHSREGFDMLDTKENWEPEKESLSDDLQSFQEYLDEEYGKDKYEAYTIGAYIHSAVSFQFLKGEDRRCQWDSGNIGFIGIPKEWKDKVDKTASMLSDAWNGWINEITVVDNLTEDIIDSCLTCEDYNYIKQWKEDAEAKYGLKETDFKIEY